MVNHDSSESPPDNQDQDDQDHDQDHDQDQDQDLEAEQAADDTEPRPAAKRQKRSRACQACRSMKIRCLPVEGQEACKACAKVNRACIMPGPARKRQKTVHKVAELEKKIDALTASLASKNSNAITVPTPPHDSPANNSTASMSATTKKPLPSNTGRQYSWDEVVERHYPTVTSEPDLSNCPMDFEQTETKVEDDGYEDAISRGVMDEASATRIYEYWKTSMAIYCPVVAFSDRVDVDWLRRKRPMTLLSILVVGSGVVVPDLQSDLAVEMARQIADRVMYLNEKSLDLIQATLIYASWYGKHKHAKDLGFNLYLHAAVAMGLDLGLGKRTRQQTYSDPEDAELRRTWMGCYYMSGSVASVLRFPPLVKSSPYIEECLESFKNHPGALPSDKFLCCLVRLTQMVQDVNILFHMDDPGSSISLSDSRTQYQLKLFERRLQEWCEDTREYLPEPMMKQYEAVVSLYIHEIALHNEHNIDDFRPMYGKNQAPDVPDITKDFLTNAHFEALTICVDSMEQAMHAFMAMDKYMLRGVPAIHIVWTAYVAVAMIRLHGVLSMPDSKYGHIFLEKLNINAFLDACVNQLNNVISDSVHIPAESFIIAFKKLKLWHVHRTMVQQQMIAKRMGKPTSDDYSKAYDASTGPPGNVAQPPFKGLITGDIISPQSMSDGNQQGSPNLLQPQQVQFQPQVSYPQAGLSYQPQQMPTPMGTGSSLLDASTTIDASTFDIQNWDFNVGELNNFETYLNDPGWMGYLM